MTTRIDSSFLRVPRALFCAIAANSSTGSAACQFVLCNPLAIHRAPLHIELIVFFGRSVAEFSVSPISPTGIAFKYARGLARR